jgi:carboxypeptidase C (cathepsin A)
LKSSITALYCAGILFAAGVASGGEPAPQPAPAVDPAVESAPHHFVTRHTATFGHTVVRYTATAGDFALQDDNGKLIGYVFSFAYTRDEVKDAASRPVMFIFNGGPGSSSLWLHMGGFGPKRVAFPEPGDTDAGSSSVLDNADSLLDVADLVFIDPIGTGFSRAAGTGKLDQFFDVRADAVATANFIRGWLAQTNRWASPKYLLGESYGTVRAALTAKYLIGGLDSGHMPLIQMNGIALLGAALTFGVASNDMAYADALPTLAATAWFHGKIDRGQRSLESFVAEVEQFAGQEYLTALYAGAGLPAKRRQEIAAQLHRYTGLSETFILRNDLRVSTQEFAAELLADAGQAVSIGDGRYTGAFPRPPLDPVGDDPGWARTGTSLSPGFLTYIRGELGVTLGARYETTNFVANLAWKPLPESYNLAVDLGRAMRQNPALRLFVGQGYFDLNTPTGATKYALAHGGVPMERVDLRQYQSGHVIYAAQSELHALSNDLRTFVAAAADHHAR